MFTYFAIAEISDDGTWTATFPDFPGICATASSYESLRASAKGALVAHLVALVERAGMTPSSQASVTCVTPGAGQHLIAIDVDIR